MNSIFKKNCCDGVYNSIDVHFTSDCDNKCSHCIDNKYEGYKIHRPDVGKIVNSIVRQSSEKHFDDVLFLGGEPCLYLEELVQCVKLLKELTDLKLYVTTSVPKICYDRYDLFIELIELLDGINLSVQHYDEEVADTIRNTSSKFDRQNFYSSLPYKDKIRINLNIVKPYLYTHSDISLAIIWYDALGFKSIKLSEIQHGAEYFVSFEDVFSINLGSPFYHGCQTVINSKELIDKSINAEVLLKRSCFMCEETLKASPMDGVKVLYKLFNKPKNNYAVIYEDGQVEGGWV